MLVELWMLEFIVGIGFEGCPLTEPLTHFHLLLLQAPHLEDPLQFEFLWRCEQLE